MSERRTKSCSRCGLVLARTAFGRAGFQRDGVTQRWHSVCKGCRNLAGAARRKPKVSVRKAGEMRGQWAKGARPC
jgi:hypothetical protein